MKQTTAPSPRLVASILALLTLAVPQVRAYTVDHNCTNLADIPQSAIVAAKNSLRIAYGHTSHGSQLTTGMDGLAGWKGALYEWNGNGSGNALQLADYYGNFGGSDAQDLGNPDFTAWEAATRTYLVQHTETNVIIWSWCGQLASATEANVHTYLSLMAGLEEDFPGVSFVYMTCHLDGSGEAGNLNQRNEQIRAYCTANNKILYDFADIESYDPDGLVNYMKLYANDNCDYDSDGDGSADANWALNWQNAHEENYNWYNCGAAHSQPLNANRKAYAAWHLWARLAGWKGTAGAPAWANAGSGNGGWYESSWYGRFYNDVNYGNWIYSSTQGFQCVWPTSTPDSTYIWDDALQNWWWTSRDFFPYIYDFTAQTWLCYVRGTCPNREFWNYAANARVAEGTL
jgi:hypothetical protein